MSGEEDQEEEEEEEYEEEGKDWAVEEAKGTSGVGRGRWRVCVGG